MEVNQTMSLIRYQAPELSTWSPFDRLSTLRDEMNRLFDISLPAYGGREDRLLGVWNPPLDVFQDKDHVFVKAELPGMKKEDIQISLQENTLTVSGERRHEKEVKEGDSYRSERFFGRFHRSVTLPVPVQTDNVKAQYKDGILTVTLAKAEEAKPKQIEVHVS
jgi:HSP20 family protein